MDPTDWLLNRLNATPLIGDPFVVGGFPLYQLHVYQMKGWTGQKLVTVHIYRLDWLIWIELLCSICWVSYRKFTTASLEFAIDVKATLMVKLVSFQSRQVHATYVKEYIICSKSF